ncbi:nuclear transport factor 2 family protein [Dyadobacter fanqingshengii]|uniref:Nuclear transport factor 2 family protein n=1 Tax=Dyadobacter fanqingshengii TaxID=2906443 RepID=A0A9X1PGM9_9BACT|nr:nuclear transport factor 2 family protein [Dyadobacter fanqingshengii]MCF0043365.1 nuclear transport factor 2 family protein [Dyadobacter fanqingshengii]USJ35835.1 nuclear transport factor 2 family protein [Dyadobacter fanqingshengii]
MKRNISVFILLILLASSFKYRSKSREAVLPSDADTKKLVSNVSLPSSTFEETVLKMQQGNREFAQGNASTFKSLWSRSEDVTNFCGLNSQESKGWLDVEKSIDDFNKKIVRKKSYSLEKIASHAGPEQGYVLQKEHYVLANGQSLDLHVTLVLRLENNQWKIVHRHSDELAMSVGSAIAVK